MSENHLETLAQVVADRTRVLILPHNDPDPDAIAAAVALRHLLELKFLVQSQIVYRGHIGRAENKAFARYLNKPLRRIRNIDLRSDLKIALVDTQPGAGNNPLPENRRADVVIDHHNWRSATQSAHFVDVRPDLGASSTILTEYLWEAEIDIPVQLATALFYGIKTDTMGLSRKASPADVAAYFYLQPRIDVNALVQIEQSQVPLAYFKSIDNALHAGRVYDGDTVIAYLGKLSYSDLGAEIADLFMRLKGIQWVLCMGVYENELVLSVRSRSKKVGAGWLVQDIIKDRGTAGGHGTMAAGHIDLISGQDPENLAEDLKEAMLISLKGAQDVECKPMI
jgi:nanoRNase/pAp phosphatase (c-di-AMP/oligoRNAs hydrolase)